MELHLSKVMQFSKYQITTLSFTSKSNRQKTLNNIFYLYRYIHIQFVGKPLLYFITLLYYNKKSHVHSTWTYQIFLYITNNSFGLDTHKSKKIGIERHLQTTTHKIKIIHSFFQQQQIPPPHNIYPIHP